LLDPLESAEKRLIQAPQLLKAAHIQLPDLRARDLEDLADGRVAGEGGVVSAVDEAAVPELDHIVDLLFCEYFHRSSFLL